MEDREPYITGGNVDRIIKFRAWCKDSKRMWNPDVIQLSTGKPGLIVEKEGTNAWMYDCPLMQYTGLKDKNGKEIYEGDILEYSGNSKGYDKIKIVEWTDKAAFIGFLIARNIDYEIIGNIYENPELLK